MTTRVWILLIVLVLALIAIAPNPWAEGIVVSNLDVTGDAADAGLGVGDILYSINEYEVSNVADVEDALELLRYEEQEVTVVTTEESLTYTVTNVLEFEVDDNLTISYTNVDLSYGSQILSINGESFADSEEFEAFYDEMMPKQTVKIETDGGLIAYISREVPDISAEEAGTSNLVFGLDFTGGTRVLLQPVSDEAEITDYDIETLIEVLSNRLNVYGLSDVKIRSAEDWEGNRYVLVEIAGVTETEVRDLIAQQGKFEAKIGEAVVFEGGEDIVYVCRNDGSCSGVRTCDTIEGQSQCSFDFAITLTEEAAQRQADATADLEVVASEGGKSYLSETIDFYLDGEQVDSLQISESLKGIASTKISISGPGYGTTESAAVEDALANMNTLQTILITGSLPFDLDIAKIDTVSPLMGESFLKNVIWVSLFAILAVAVVLFVRYKSVKIIIPVIVTAVSELFLILGFAAVVQWNLDMVAFAGILAAVGTGVDDQIVILDETIKGKDAGSGWKEKMKRAFFVIFVAYATTVAAMVPLWNAGAGLIRGFALTTIAGVTIGVFLTRPAFAAIVEKMFKE
jgi:preprotein translocase subunit SecD